MLLLFYYIISYLSILHYIIFYYIIFFFFTYMYYYESQPVGLAEVIAESEASLGGPGGGQLSGDNRSWSCTFSRLMYQVAIGWWWVQSHPGPYFRGSEKKLRYVQNPVSQCFLQVFLLATVSWLRGKRVNTK